MYGAKNFYLNQKSKLLNLSKLLLYLIETLIVDELISKLNLQFPNNKISTRLYLDSIIDSGFTSI